MYLHVGNGKSVKKKNVVGIFDLDTATVSKISRDFVNKKEKEGKLEYDYADLPRSFVLSDEGDGRVILSRISTQGLKIRINEEISTDSFDCEEK